MPEQLIAQTAAALIVEEGLTKQHAKLRAIESLGLSPRTRLPSNETIESAVEEYISIYCKDTQPHELDSLRRMALQWMTRLEPFQPLIEGAVWRGTATRFSNIHLQIFSDDPKEPAIFLLNEGIAHEIEQAKGMHNKLVTVLGLHDWSQELQDHITVHLWINDTSAIKGALQKQLIDKPLRGSYKSLFNKTFESS